MLSAKTRERVANEMRILRAMERNQLVKYIRNQAEYSRVGVPVLRAGKFKDLLNRYTDELGSLCNKAEAEAYKIMEEENGRSETDRVGEGSPRGVVAGAGVSVANDTAVKKGYRVFWRTPTQEGEIEVEAEGLPVLGETILSVLFPPVECPMIVAKIELIDPEQYLT